MESRKRVFLYQSAKGYRYNSDTIFLYDFVSRFAPKGRVLDIGCGSGILSLLLARDFPVDVTAVEKQTEVALYAEHNYSLNAVPVSLREGDFLKLPFDERFDYIVSNPPFYGGGSLRSPNSSVDISRHAEHLPADELVKRTASLLENRGYFIFCYDAKQCDLLLSLLREAKINPEYLRFVHPKADREAKIVLIAARKGSRALLRVLPPLIVFDENGEYAAEALEAFRRANTHSIKGERWIEERECTR
jgi:tRNA1(Val) A37 N6-methylase TrmN6